MAAANLRGIEIGGGARPEIAVVLDGPIAAPKTFVLDDPLRLIVDFDGVAPVRRSVDGGGVVVRVRAGQFDPQTVRLVIELSRPMTVIAARQAADGRLLLQLAPVSRAQFDARLGKPRVVVAPFIVAGKAAAATADFDLPADAFGAAPPAAETARAEVLPPEPAAPEPAPRRRGGKLPVVMIDAGH
ncbi:MAG TPA: AMIN domain-containing protein, partial [Polymorphobacter sp.]|nr:AMIN domain-containing protein [Polymorphobacter sp.]